MRRAALVLVALALLLVPAPASAADRAHVGWGAGTTGGVGGTTWTVRTRAELKEALANRGDPAAPKVIRVVGDVNGHEAADGSLLGEQDYAPGYDLAQYMSCFGEDGAAWSDTRHDYCRAAAAAPADGVEPGGRMRGHDAVGRRAFVVAAGAAALFAGGGASGAEAAVVDGPLPDFHPALKDGLTFPLAWGRSPIRDFRAWRRTARAKVEELLIVDRDQHTPYVTEFGARSEAAGYSRELVTLSLTRYERVRGALLTPHGPGPFPAVLLLHDHGAKFDIGKEKLVRPWYDDARLASAQAWADKYFSGRFVGDELARRGYVVLCLDALGWGDRGPLTYDRQQALASNFYHLGSSLAGLMAREDARAAGLPGEPRPRGRAPGRGRRVLHGRLPRLADGRAQRRHRRRGRRLLDDRPEGNDGARQQHAARAVVVPHAPPRASPVSRLPRRGGHRRTQADALLRRRARPAVPRRRRPRGVRQAARRLALPPRRGAVRLETWPDLGHVFVDRMQDEVFAWLDSAL